MIEIGILGGGAAGYFCAIQIAERYGDRVKISIFEKSSEPLGKVKISGGGRCNVTHHLFDPILLSQKYPRGSKELRYAFEIFQPKDTIEWFESRGVKLKVEQDGRMFPVTDNSATIINCFKSEIDRLNIHVKLKTPIRNFQYLPEKSKPFEMISEEQEIFSFDKVVITSGSNRQVWDWIEKLGHKIEDPVPSLFTLNLEDPDLLSLPGLSVPEAEIRIHPKGKPQYGPLLITHWGISGPAVLRLSAWEARTFHDLEYKTEIKINWLGKVNSENCQIELINFKNSSASKKLITNPFGIPTRLWKYFLDKSGISEEKRWSDLSNLDLNKLKENLCHSIFLVKGKSVFKEEFVTCGGVKRKEINFNTMQSKIVPGLFFAGEVIDIDGITGGFNFQNAWTTAYIAAKSLLD